MIKAQLSAIVQALENDCVSASLKAQRIITKSAFQCLRVKGNAVRYTSEESLLPSNGCPGRRNPEGPDLPLFPPPFFFFFLMRLSVYLFIFKDFIYLTQRQPEREHKQRELERDKQASH